MKYLNRFHAGKELATKLTKYKNKKNILILALPRGGVPVAFEVAKKINAHLDIFLVRKIGLPGHEEFAIGAIASGGITFLNQESIKNLNIKENIIKEVITKEEIELKRREKTYRKNRESPNLTGKTIILIDDGIATGATIMVAIKAIKIQNPEKIIVAVPVAAPDSYNKISMLVDEIICPICPNNFEAVGKWYNDFTQTSDHDVINILSNFFPV